MDSSVTTTRQGVRNLNSLGPKRKRLEVREPDPEASDGKVAQAPPQVRRSTADTPLFALRRSR
jgi:hypothetical protein